LFRPRKAIVWIGSGIIISICVYGARQEAFFFGYADTRTIAREWICRNIPPSFAVSGSAYSADDPYAGYTGQRNAGELFVSSCLAGMPIPPNGILVKEFSMENRMPGIIRRNPSLKVFVVPGRDIKKGFKIPPFSHCPARKSGTGLVFLNGKDFGIDPLQFQINPGRQLMLVSEEGIRKIAVSLTNSFSATGVTIKLGREERKIGIAPYETRIILFEHPAREFPFTKHFYKLSIDKEEDTSQVFVKIGTDSYKIGKPYYDAGLYREAIKYFEKAKESYETAILLAECYRKTGQVEKAAELNERIGNIDDTGLSEEILRNANTVRFESTEFTAHRGQKVIDEGKSCIAISCQEREEDCIYGPYDGFPHGSFIARYKLKISDVSSDTKIKLDVAARLGDKIITETFLEPKKTEGFIGVELPFRIDTPAEILEFRIALTGKGEILLDYVEIFPDITASIN
jgi:hypothetical protein